MKKYIYITPEGYARFEANLQDEDAPAQISNLTAVLAQDSPPEAPDDFSQYHLATGQWVDERTPQTQWRLVRLERGKRLEASDWTDTASARARLGTEVYEAWQTYRQALRDITLQTDPFNIVWPSAPPN
jgi:hypothetical protein